MNIKQAKQEIENAMKAYFTKDETGNYVIPIEKQRPVFLMGPPGIGKTAIMEQIAAEMGVGILSYSMTHHTRQSAMGLPFIVHKNYDGMECDVSEYTMSEIISAIYELMEKSGVKEGILFLDEINCVSETLAPVMLQFLQYKVFGRHKVPKGWIVVTAGNPPEYNNSVRDYDIVTWDRLKRIDVDADFDVWKEYAYKAGVHEAIISFLEIKKDYFYIVESTVDGKNFVTARGWEDLSRMIKLYEYHGIEVNEELVGQYLQHQKVAKAFARYYDLYNKYKSDYQISQIIEGNYDEEIVNRAQNAKFDEKVTVVGLLLDAITGKTSEVVKEDQMLAMLKKEVKSLESRFADSSRTPYEVLQLKIADKKSEFEAGKASGTLSSSAQKNLLKVITSLEKMAEETEMLDGETAFAKCKEMYVAKVRANKEKAARASANMDNMFKFADKAFPDGGEQLMLVTELTAGYYCVQFIAKYGNEEYFKHNQQLMFYERDMEIIGELENLDLN